MVLAHSVILHFPVRLLWLEKTLDLCVVQTMHGNQGQLLKTIGVVAQPCHPSVGEAETDLSD